MREGWIGGMASDSPPPFSYANSNAHKHNSISMGVGRIQIDELCIHIGEVFIL